MTDGPRGLVVSDAFVDYLEDLRETCPPNDVLAAEHGSAAENGHSQNTTMSETNTTEAKQATDIADRRMNRRQFVAAAGAAAAAAASAGTASGQSTGTDTGEENMVPNFSSEYTPAPWIPGSVTVGTHRGDMPVLGYIGNNDSDDEFSELGDFGAVVAPRVDDSTPHNPIRFNASNITSEEFSTFPRGETYDDDGDSSTDEVPVSALDSVHWTTDASGSAGTVSVSDSDGSLVVETSSQTSGDVASATFSDFTISDGEARRILQLVLGVNTLESGTVVTVRVTDGSGLSTEAVIDPSADTAATSTIATAQGDVVYQVQLGELTNGTDLDTIEELEVEVAEGNASLRFDGINLERTAKWQFGERESLNSDDEVVTNAVTEPAGETGVTDLEGLLSDFGEAVVVEQLKYDVEFRASQLPATAVDATTYEPARDSSSLGMRSIIGFEFPSGAYEVSVSLEKLMGQVRHPSDWYQRVGFNAGLSEIPDLGDESDISWTDATSTFTDGSYGSGGEDDGDEVEVTNTVDSGNVIAFYSDIRGSDKKIINAMVTKAGSGGGVAPSSGGSFMASPLGWLTAGVTGVSVAVLGWYKGIKGGNSGGA